MIPTVLRSVVSSRAVPSWAVLVPLLALGAPSLPASGALGAVAPRAAGPQESEEPERAEEPSAEPAAPRERIVTTEHAVTIGGREVRYRAQAGTLVLAEEEGEPRASVFHVAYLALDADGSPQPERPVTFCFNGGPGSSSVWLHLGVFGPRRVPMPDEPVPPRPPYALVDNEHSFLDVTDLVFVDPVTTGYSRAAPGVDDAEFHGVEADVEAVGEFVRLWTTRNGRWGSAKLLAGESYGTTRAAALAEHLQERHGLYLNGLLLVSSILDFQTARFDAGNDLPYPLFLPTYAATAHYHGRLAPELQARPLREVLDEVEAFALGDYWLALARGNDLADAERAEIAVRVARYTGLSPDHVAASNLRVQIHRFVKELRRDERVTVGRLDSRYTGVDRDAAGERYEADPSYDAIQGAYTAGLNAYVRGELGFESDLPYEILTGRVHPWSWGSRNGYLNVAERLRRAMAQNPWLRVWVANGYYDLATPYFATEYTFDHLAFERGPRDLAARVSMSWYPAGHMMYVHGPSLAAMKRDGAAFVRACTE